ncbi:MAG: ABC transporter ATP-binding protein [Coprobacillaceae bacterium]
MIQIKGLSKKIGNKLILDDIQLEIPKGSIYGIIGANGAGKTTLIRHMVGAYKPDMGYIEIDGNRVYENPHTKEKLVYIPDEFPMTFGNRVADIEKLYREIYPNFNRERYQQLMQRFNKSSLDNFTTFSKGMKKQVLFILALSIQPEYLIMDEPFDGLDPQIRKEIWDILIDDVANRQMTIFISSHHLHELDAMCDHIALLHQGKLFFEKSLEELKNSYHKYQLVVKNESDIMKLKQELHIVDYQYMGRIHTMIIEGELETIASIIDAYEPIVNECLPVRLEEIFIFTLGGVNDEIQEVLG